MVAELGSDLIRARVREGIEIAKAKGYLRGRQPELSAAQHRHLLEMNETDTHSVAELAELSGIDERPYTDASTVTLTRPLTRPIRFQANASESGSATRTARYRGALRSPSITHRMSERAVPVDVPPVPAGSPLAR